MTEAALVDPRLSAALVAASVSVAVWLASAMRDWLSAGRQRKRAVFDVQRALYAEIRAYLAVLKRDDVAVYGARTAGRIRSEPGFFPIIPREDNAMVFAALLPQIHLLPRAAIDPVVLYYSQIKAINLLIDDLRDIDPAQTEAGRAAAMYEDYIAMKVEALDLGEDALLMMGGYIEGGPERLARIEAHRKDEESARLKARVPALAEEMNEMRARLSSPGADRSGQ